MEEMDGTEEGKIVEMEFVKIPGKHIKMLKTVVTQAMYESVMGESPKWFVGANRPMTCISWYDAIYFCNKLSEMKGKEPVYVVDGAIDVTKWNYTPHEGETIEGNITQDEYASGFRLPTLAEWEYVARGGENYTYAGSDDLDEVGWYDENSGNKTHSVAQKKPNSYGLYDMSGNVWEWIWDSGDDDDRYICGGSYDSDANRCEVVNGFSYYADKRSFDLGFRLVCPSFILRDNEL
jgi:formylglycine-generating enzyme